MHALHGSCDNGGDSIDHNQTAMQRSAHTPDLLRQGVDAFHNDDA